MEYIYAAMLLHKAGKKIDEASVKKVLEAAEVKVDEARIKAYKASAHKVKPVLGPARIAYDKRGNIIYKEMRGPEEQNQKIRGQVKRKDYLA